MHTFCECILKKRGPTHAHFQYNARKLMSLKSVYYEVFFENIKSLDDVSRWPAANKMVTNAAKMKCLLVTGKRIPCKLDNCSLELKLVNSDIEQVDSQKLLGVTIDKHLSFDVHVEELCKKLSQRIAVLRKIRRFIPIEQRILYYNAMIKQVMRMIYGSTIWSNCSADNLTRISSCKNMLPE